MITRFLQFILGAIVALLGLALTGLIALDIFFPKNPWTGAIKGQVLVLLWDRQSPLSCTDNSIMLIEARTFDRPFGPLFDASGNCQLHLLNVRAKAPRVVAARENARVVITGGRLESPTAVLDLTGNAVVRIEGAELVGAIQKEGAARVER